MYQRLSFPVITTSFTSALHQSSTSTGNCFKKTFLENLCIDTVIYSIWTDIRPDTGYKKGRIIRPGPDIWCIPTVLICIQLNAFREPKH
jgi:hypothetical protein